MYEKFWNSGVSIKISRNKETGKSVHKKMTNLPAQIHTKRSTTKHLSVWKAVHTNIFFQHIFFCMLNYSRILIDSYLWSLAGQMTSLTFFGFFIIYKKVDSMLSCVCSGIDHRRCQNMVRTSVIHLFCSYHIWCHLWSTCTLYYQTNTQIHGMYLLIRV